MLSEAKSVWDGVWDTDVDGVGPSLVADGAPAAKSFTLPLNALNISTGKSATPMVRLAKVPNRAEAPPEIGSHGPSSVSYSRGR